MLIGIDHSQKCIVKIDDPRGTHYSQGAIHCWMEGRLTFPRVAVGEQTRFLVSRYLELGEQFLRECEGSFCVVLWDEKTQELRVFADKFQTIPAYYLRDQRFLAVGTNARLVQSVSGKTPALNPRKHVATVGTHYRYLYHPQTETLFEDVRCLNAGTGIMISAAGTETLKYWDLELLELGGMDELQLQEEYIQRLESSVADCLQVSDKPAFTISSGIDSSSIVALAAASDIGKMSLYTSIFDIDTEHDESLDVVPIIEMFQTEWSKPLVRGEALWDKLLEVSKELSSPLATITQMLHVYLADAIHEDGHQCIIGGLGGDEANCGEVEEYLYYLSDLKINGESERLDAEIKGWIDFHGTAQYPKSREVFETWFKHHIVDPNGRKNCLEYSRYRGYLDVFTDSYRATLTNEPEVVSPFSTLLQNKLYQDLFYECIPPVLHGEYASSRRKGILNLYPYMDSRVMSFGFSVDANLKYQHGRTKYFTRKALRGRLPDATLTNFTKRGWNGPFDSWFSTSLSHLVTEILEKPSGRHTDCYDITRLRTLLTEHVSGVRNHMMFFWQFLSFEAFYKTHFE